MAAKVVTFETVEKAQRKIIVGQLAPPKKDAPPLRVDTIATIKAEAELLAERLQHLETKQVRSLCIQASDAQAADIVRLATIRASRKALDEQEAAIVARLRVDIDAAGAAKIVSGAGNYCYEPVSGTVVVRLAGSRYVLRT